MRHVRNLILTLLAPAIGLSFLLGGTALLGRTSPALEGAQEGGPSPNDLPHPYKTVQTWKFQLSDGTKMGYTNGIDIAPNGNVMVMTRCGAGDCASEITASGRVEKNFGEGIFVEPHGLFVDKDSNVWITDATVVAVHAGEAKDPKKGYTVVEFSPTGKVLLTLGKPGVKGNDSETFGGPSDVAVAPNGDIFVADGHGGCDCPNSRIVKFSKDGKFIKAWGQTGSNPGDFKGPHALMFDSAGRLFVGDGGNARIQIFTQDGQFIAEWKQFGHAAGIFIDKNDTLYAADSAAKGIFVGSAKTGKVTGFIQTVDPEDGKFGVEGVVVDHNGAVYSQAISSDPATKDQHMLKKYEKR